MKYFGTDGFRGKANEALTADHAFRIGKFLGWYFTEGATKKAACVIGKDTRRSSYMFEYALAAGLSWGGADVYLLHVTTTPSVSYVTKSGNFDFGIMITASHNPFYDNGIKIIDSEGFKMEESVLEKVEEYLDGKVEITAARNDRIGRITDHIQGRNQYISYLTSTAIHSFRGYRVGLDCANGAASSIAKTVFEMLGAKTYMIHNEPDGLNINVDCGSTHVESLRRFVAENGLDVGFAFDGDADRCFAVDEKGNVLDGDLILYLCAVDMKEKGALIGNAVVATVASNLGVEKALNREGIRMERTPVGDKYVSARMQEGGYSIGGEESGHIIFSKYSTTGDGILTAIRVMEILVEKKTLPSFLTAGVQLFPKVQINKRVKDASAVLEREAVKQAVSQAEEELGETGRVLIRKSGTEPVIRLIVEADEEEKCRRLAERIASDMEEERIREGECIRGNEKTLGAAGEADRASGDPDAGSDHPFYRDLSAEDGILHEKYPLGEDADGAGKIGQAAVSGAGAVYGPALRVLYRPGYPAAGGKKRGGDRRRGPCRFAGTIPADVRKDGRPAGNFRPNAGRRLGLL